MFVGIAHAADAAAPQAGAAGAFGQFIPLILIFVVFYFLLIRPQQKAAKKQQNFLSNLKRGTRIVTKGGILGTITDLSDRIVTLEIAKDLTIEITRDSIAGQVDKKGEAVGAAKKDDKKPKIG